MLKLPQRFHVFILVVATFLMLSDAYIADAQAEWRSLGKGLSSNETLSGGAVGTTTLSSTLAGVTVEVHCEVSAIESALMLLIPFVDSHVVLQVKSCKTLLNHSTSAACKPAEPIKISANASPVLHEGRVYLLVKPASGESFGVLKFSEECSIGEKYAIGGSLVAECVNGTSSCGEELVTHSLKPASAALFPAHKLLLGKSTATLSGSMTAKMSGALSGCKWSGII